MYSKKLATGILLASILLGGSILTLAPTGFADAATKTRKVCCKICTTGKACGNSCISRKYQCHKAPGCACNG